MALKLATTYSNLSVPNAVHAIVEAHFTSPDSLRMEVGVFVDLDALFAGGPRVGPLSTVRMSGFDPKSATNAHTQGYNYLLTLPEYSGVDSVLAEQHTVPATPYEVTLAHAPIAGTDVVKVGGTTLVRNTDYTIAGAALTFIAAHEDEIISVAYDWQVFDGAVGINRENKVVPASPHEVTLEHAPLADGETVIADGVTLVRDTDYTVAGAVLTFIAAHEAAEIVVDYTW